MTKREYMKSKGVWCLLKPSILDEEVDDSFKEFVEGILKAREIYLNEDFSDDAD